MRRAREKGDVTDLFVEVADQEHAAAARVSGERHPPRSSRRCGRSTQRTDGSWRNGQRARHVNMVNGDTREQAQAKHTTQPSATAGVGPILINIVHNPAM